jgi:hypothetical protein
MVALKVVVFGVLNPKQTKKGSICKQKTKCKRYFSAKLFKYQRISVVCFLVKIHFSEDYRTLKLNDPLKHGLFPDHKPKKLLPF